MVNYLVAAFKEAQKENKRQLKKAVDLVKELGNAFKTAFHLLRHRHQYKKLCKNVEGSINGALLFLTPEKGVEDTITRLIKDAPTKTFEEIFGTVAEEINESTEQLGGEPIDPIEVYNNL